MNAKFRGNLIGRFLTFYDRYRHLGLQLFTVLFPLHDSLLIECVVYLNTLSNNWVA